MCNSPSKRDQYNQKYEIGIETPVLAPGTICEGTICQLNLTPGCDKNGEVYGDYHTHPSGSSDPSAGDLLEILYRHFFEGSPIFQCRSGATPGINDPEAELPFGGGGTRCDAVKPGKTPSYEQYTEWSKKYKRDVSPFYDEWNRTGTPPINHPGRTTNNELTRELTDLFETMVFLNINDMEKGVLEVTTPADAMLSAIPLTPKKMPAHPPQPSQSKSSQPLTKLEKWERYIKIMGGRT